MLNWCVNNLKICTLGEMFVDCSHFVVSLR